MDNWTTRIISEKFKEDFAKCETTISSLRTEMFNHEKKLGEKESEISKLKMELIKQKNIKDKTGRLVKSLRREKNEILSDHTSLNLKKMLLRMNCFIQEQNMKISKEKLNRFKLTIYVCHRSMNN
eukprot:TRINITY_DN38165_c0_g1_i1.p1 TRINITY_DN38165_c0_g1~~TRINITY_DN38165_c0_g1_i1.p1  ORF type:complete len:125 (-),score=25.79 TRINITY_DN38165_c0_g1_i1:19-393(-)